jgi:heme a synthase
LPALPPFCRSSPSCPEKMLHRFSTFVAACTVLLILAGSLVTSHGAGLSVPDWPTSYGWNMFTFPPSMWVANILYEHGHRLVASTVGFLTIILAAWLWVAEPRHWLRWLGIAALGTVVAQGVLGGLTVLFFLPAAVSTAHAGLAEVFFCIVVSIALFTSPGWSEGYGRTVRLKADTTYEGVTTPEGVTPYEGVTAYEHVTASKGAALHDDRRIRTLTTLTTVLIYAQILLGATMRHTGAGLAIPDFPLMFGGWLPTHWDSRIAVHFSHRIGAVVVALGVLIVCRYVWTRSRDGRGLVRPATVLVALVALQVTLGALTVLSRLNPWINSVHVVCGALVLATSLVLTLRSWRGAFADAKDVSTVRLPPSHEASAFAEASAGAEASADRRSPGEGWSADRFSPGGGVQAEPVRLEPDTTVEGGVRA